VAPAVRQQLLQAWGVLPWQLVQQDWRLLLLLLLQLALLLLQLPLLA